ncbi:hypothetical protein Tco_0880975 [Tanacetum coccineum]
MKEISSIRRIQRRPIHRIEDIVCEDFRRYQAWSILQETPNTSWKEDGYCNGGNLPGAYIVGNTLRYQDLEWYDALKDSELKDKALRNKAIMEGLIDEDNESSNNEDKERCKLFDNHELPVCNIRKFEMIKYSFRDDDEYVAVKEDEYDELTNTSKEAIHAYRVIFRMMDEGWMVIIKGSYGLILEGVMDPNLSLGKICLGEDVVVISSDKVEGSGDWNSTKFQDTANSGQKNETKMDCDGEIDDMLRIRLREARSDKDIFTSVAWIRAFNINELIYAELCYEFYSTYEFDEVCADDELQTKKIIKFRLGRRAHSLTLLEFA